ncbi:unnamed protein product [Orchesella dallaii]|uniref:Transmembrane protein n=1 Tax=Orchesella dallaii TaxID=48710 RepID=A0ABP1S8T9_9HEXA
MSSSCRYFIRLFVYVIIFLVYFYLAVFVINHYRNSIYEHGIECHDGSCNYSRPLSKDTIPNESGYAVILMGLILSIPFCGIYWCIRYDPDTTSLGEPKMYRIRWNPSSDSDVSYPPIHEHFPRCVECRIEMMLENERKLRMDQENPEKSVPVTETVTQNKTPNGGRYWQNLRIAVNRMMLGRKMAVADNENLIPVSDSNHNQIVNENQNQGQQ